MTKNKIELSNSKSDLNVGNSFPWSRLDIEPNLKYVTVFKNQNQNPTKSELHNNFKFTWTFKPDSQRIELMKTKSSYGKQNFI